VVGSDAWAAAVLAGSESDAAVAVVRKADAWQYAAAL